MSLPRSENPKTKQIHTRLYGKIKCPKCQTAYRITDNRRFRRLPVLLSCGHSCCETCTQSTALHICSLCNEKTVIIKGQPVKHLYVLGLVAESNSRPFSLDTKLKMMLDPIRVCASTKYTEGNCQECNEVKAMFSCKQCSTLLCDSCWSKVHAHKTMRTHQPQALHMTQAAYLKPHCPKHPQIIATHICNTCSQKQDSFIGFCTTCLMFGRHSQHDVAEFSNVEEQYMTEIEVTVEELTETLYQLQESREQCEALVNETWRQHGVAAREMQAWTHRMHGLLQLVEEMAMANLNSITDKLSDNLAQMVLKIDDSIMKREGLLQEAHDILNGKGSHIHIEKFVKHMKSMTLDYPVIHDSNETQDGLFAWEVVDELDEIVQDVIPNCIRVLETENRFSLVSKVKKQDEGNEVSEEVTEMDKPLHCLYPSRDSDLNNQPQNSTDKSLSISTLLKKVSAISTTSDTTSSGKTVKEFGDENEKGTTSEVESHVISKCTSRDELEDVVVLRNESNPLHSPNDLPRRDEDLHNGREVLPLRNEADYSLDKDTPLFLKKQKKEGKLKSVVIENHEIDGKELKDVQCNNLLKRPEDFEVRKQPVEQRKMQPKRPSLFKAQSLKKMEEKPYPSTARDVNYNFTGNSGSVKVSHVGKSFGARPKTWSLKNLRRSVSTASLHLQLSGVPASVQTSKTTSFGVNEEVVVTHVESPSAFYIQRTVDSSKLQLMSRVINVIARGETSVSDPIAGKVYLAQYSKDNIWYRAAVVSVAQDMKEVVVRYVDYGNRELIKVTRLRVCPPAYQLEKVPSFGYICGLWELTPAKGDTWDSDAVNVFAELVNGVPLKLMLVDDKATASGGKYQVDLWRPSTIAGIANDDPVSIREVLVFLESALYVNYSPQDLYNKHAATSWKRSYFRQEVPFGKDGTCVLLSSLTTPHDFYLQLTSTAMHLTKLMADMQKHYTSPHVLATVDWRIYAPRIGMLCVALYTGDNKWYRALVEDIPGRKQVDVRYVDYGNKERLWYKQLYKIAEDFLKLPAQAVKCRLHEINPVGESWACDVAEHMATICDGKDLKAYFHNCIENVCTVSLIACSDEPEDVGEQLMELGLAEAPENFKLHYQKYQAFRLMAGEDTARTKKQLTRKRILQEKVQAPVMAPGAVCAGKRYVLVEYLTALSVSRIQLRLASQTSLYKELQNKLDEYLNQIFRPPDFKPVIGELCAIKLTQAPFCARAKILQLDCSHAQVLLIDCGGIKEVELSQMFPLPESLATYKNLALLVSLAGIAPPMGKSGWPGITFDRLREQLSTRSNLYMKRKGRSFPDHELGVKVMPVELGWMQEEAGGPFEANTVLHISINELLIEYGVALPARAVVHDEPNFAEISSQMSSTCTLTSEKTTSCEDFCLQEAESMSIISMMTTQENVTCNTSLENCEKIKEWVPSPPPSADIFNATASYIDHNGVIYLQPVANARNIELIREGQTMQFSGTVPTDEDLCWSPGDPVVALFHLDKKWYRATILEMECDGQVKVQFVDYGNEETVTLHHLRRNITFGHLPIQCHRAVLHGIVPNTDDGKWEIQLLDFIHRTVVEKECRVQVQEKPRENGILKVKLEIMDVAIDLASLLADKMKVCKRIPDSMALPEDEDTSDVVVESETSMDSELNSYPPLPVLSLPNNPGDSFPVRVTAVRDPSHVYITPVLFSMEAPSDLQKIAEETSRACSNFISEVLGNSNANTPVSNPVIGEMYLGKSFRGEWCRVLVRKVDPAGITVFYVDSGNIGKIPEHWLLECPQEGRNIPASAVCVKLHRVEPCDGPSAPWDEEALKCITACFMQSSSKIFHALIKERGCPAEVEIFRIDGQGNETLAYADAVSRGLVALRKM